MYPNLRMPLYDNPSINEYIEKSSSSTYMVPKEKVIIKYKRYLSTQERRRLFEGLKVLLGHSIIFYDTIGLI